MSGPEWVVFLYFKYWYFRSLKRFWDCDFFVNVLELHHSTEERKMICTIKVFMKSYAGNWQINCNSRNWRNQMTEQYRTIGPEIQGFFIGLVVILPDLSVGTTVFRFHCVVNHWKITVVNLFGTNVYASVTLHVLNFFLPFHSNIL